MTDILHSDRLSTVTMAGRPDVDLSFPTPLTDTQCGVLLTLSPERSPPQAVQVSPDLDKPNGGLEDVQCKMESVRRKEQRTDRSPNRSLKKTLEFETGQTKKHVSALASASVHRGSCSSSSSDREKTGGHGSMGGRYLEVWDEDEDAEYDDTHDRYTCDESKYDQNDNSTVDFTQGPYADIRHKFLAILTTLLRRTKRMIFVLMMICLLIRPTMIMMIYTTV